MCNRCMQNLVILRVKLSYVFDFSFGNFRIYLIELNIDVAIQSCFVTELKYCASNVCNVVSHKFCGTKLLSYEIKLSKGKVEMLSIA